GLSSWPTSTPSSSAARWYGTEARIPCDSRLKSGNATWAFDPHQPGRPAPQQLPSLCLQGFQGRAPVTLSISGAETAQMRETPAQCDIRHSGTRWCLRQVDMCSLHALLSHVGHRRQAMVLFERGTKTPHARAAGLSDTAKVEGFLQMSDDEFLGQPHIAARGA